MNAILLGAACLGALVTFFTADVPEETAHLAPGQGSMTTHASFEPAYGERTETLTIAFLD